MTHTKDEALKLALEALETDPLEMIEDEDEHMVFRGDVAITAIRQALLTATPLAAPVQQSRSDVEPVAWMWEQKAAKSSSGIGGWDKMVLFCKPVDDPFVEKRNLAPLYTTPPYVATPLAAQRQWAGLTDEDKLTVRRIPWETLGDLMDNIEAKLKEKNT